MDNIIPGSVTQSITFVIFASGLDITAIKLAYIRYTPGDGTTFVAPAPVALTELVAINSAHSPNQAKYLDTDVTSGNSFHLRVDFPDAPFAAGAENVICNVLYEADVNVIGSRLFSLNNNVNNATSRLVASQTLMRNLITLTEAQDDKFNQVFKEIQDLKRELLRGDRDIRR